MASSSVVPSGYVNGGGVDPDWLNKGDNAWQLTAATLVGIQCVPGLVILYGSIVKKKWAVNSAFMALYAYAASLLCWVTWAYKMSFGEKLLPLWGKAGTTLSYKYLQAQANLPSTTQYHHRGDGTLSTSPSPSPSSTAFFDMASLVFFQFQFAAITLILLAGSVLGRMSFRAWMLFVPLWLTLSYTVGAFSVWGGGFLWQWGVIDYSGGYVIHLSSGVAGFTAAYWVGPRLPKDRERFPPNNMLLMLAGAGLLWMGWTGFNGGTSLAANLSASVAVLNTHVCAATSLLTWTTLDVLLFGKPSVIGAVQGMMTGLVVITPAAGVVSGWASIVMGILAGCVPWFTMMIIHKHWSFLQKVDDTLGVFHTHAVAGLLGGICAGLFAEPLLCSYLSLGVPAAKGFFFGSYFQLVKQVAGALFIIVWNVISTSLILFVIGLVLPLRMSDAHLLIGDDAEHGEEAYALWGDGEKYNIAIQQASGSEIDYTHHGAGMINGRGTTVHT
ncbi:unnamed protein product [Sphagnum jensenii]|uniref:Uncharacterized protein n=2 Tax=Sphagnum jensenii TaxID=128206 RepID=A0ABP1BH14_9BRYO